MTASNPRREWGIALRAIAIFVMVAAALFSLPYTIATLGSARGILIVLAVAVVLALFTALFIKLIAALFKRNVGFLRTALIAGLIWFAVGLIAIASPMLGAQYINASKPLLVPRVTLTDGKKTVIFQGMVHVASKPYYESIVFDMLRARDDGFVFFYEGVGPGSEANKQRLGELLGTGNADINGAYNTLSNVCGLSFQGDFFKVFREEAKREPQRHKVADVSIDAMIAEWDRLVQADPNLANALPARAGSARAQAGSANTDATSASFVDLYKLMSEGQQGVIGTLCKAVMNTRLSASETDGSPFNRLVVLDFRNKHLADEIQNATDSKIYVTYGAGHMRGVYQLLKQRNPVWRVADVTWLTVIQPVPQQEGVLNLEP